MKAGIMLAKISSQAPLKAAKVVSSPSPGTGSEKS
jgi:hypothetical protein